MNIAFSNHDIDRYRKVAFRAALRTGLDHDSAEDVAQESLIVLYKYRDRLESSRAIESWLSTTATRRAIRRIAELRRTTALNDVADTAVNESDLVGKIDSERVRQSLLEMVGRLPEVQRRLLDGLYVDGLSYAEVAKRLGLAIGTVGPTRGRALSNLFASSCEEQFCVA